MHSRRARPTLRILREDLTAGWESPQPQRCLADAEFTGLHPFCELPHPLIRKAAESFGDDPADDKFVGRIACSTTLLLLEIRAGQWRGGVWIDEEQQVAWLVTGGLAKGGHEDRDDFYVRLGRDERNGGLGKLVPTEQDKRFLKRETAGRMRTDWELRVQEQVLVALTAVQSGGVTRFSVDHPNTTLGRLADVQLEVTPVREKDYNSDDILVTFTTVSCYTGTNLAWDLTTRVLISLHPPEQDWDRYRDIFSNIAEPGTWSARVTKLRQLADGRCLAESEPGRQAHYTHRKHLAQYTVEGEAVRALCGSFFVPTQDHDALPTCPTCTERMAELPD